MLEHLEIQYKLNENCMIYSYAYHPYLQLN